MDARRRSGGLPPHPVVARRRRARVPARPAAGWDAARYVGRVLGPVLVVRAVAVLGLTLVLGVALVLGELDRARGDSGGAWPVAGAGPGSVTRGFNPPASRYGAGHRGVDLAAAPGTTVRAAGAGRVSYAGLLAGRGVVVVQHGDLRTTYEPVTVQVVVGDAVTAGAPLGRLDPGHAGCPAAACLHWGLRRGEEYLDPLSLVGAGPVRLLPLGAAADPRAPTGAGPAPPSGVLPAPGAEPAAERGDQPPALDLRSAVTPSGVLALVALLAGLALLVRPGPPRRPAGGAALERPAPPAVAAVDDRPRAPVLDLDAERLRRAAGG